MRMRRSGSARADRAIGPRRPIGRRDASQGLDAAVGAAFRARGCRVVATSRTIEPSSEPESRTVRGDIGDRLTGPRVIDETLRCFGRADMPVNNAGIALRGPFGDSIDEDDLRTVGDQSRRLLAHHARGDQRDGAAEERAYRPGHDHARRAGNAARGIRVNALSLGVVKTPMHLAEQHDAPATLHPLGRMGEIDDWVRGLPHLEDATFVTGEILHVDPGPSAGS